MEYRVAGDDLEHRAFGHGGAVAALFHGGEHGLKAVSLMLGEVEPGDGAPLHRHPYEEVFVIHSGRGAYTIDGVTVEAGPSDIVLIPAHAPHSFINPGGTLLRHTAVHAGPKIIIEWLEASVS